MHALKSIAAMTVICLTAGCTTPPPKSEQVFHDPLLARQNGALLLVDACIQRDEIGDSDYFVIDESQSGAQAMLEALHKYLASNDVLIRTEVISVCGARLNAERSAITVADSVDGMKRQAQQPLRVSGPNTDDRQFVQALGVVSTYAFERAAVKKNKKTNETEPLHAISADDFRVAAAVLKKKTQASTVLFVGALGTSLSGGKKAAQFLGSMVVGVGTAIATAGLGTGYYAIFMPGHQIDGAVMEGALIDLETGKLTWSNAVRAAGDPVQPKVLSNSDTLDLLLRDIMFQSASNRPAPSNQ